MTRKYQITLAPAAQRQIKKLSPSVRRAILKRLEALASNPRPDGVKKLSGSNDFYRIRAGDHRIIYTIDDGVFIVLVVKVGNRKEVYRNF